MKRLFAILLAGALLLSLAGCQSSNPKLQDPSFAPLAMTPGDTYTSYDGMNIQIDSLIWHETEYKTTLIVALDNDTCHDVTYGAAYVIERLDGEEWVSCAMQDELAFISIGYELKAGQMKNESYDLTNTYDVSSPGTYRFKTDCFVYETAEKSTKCELIAEFTVDNVKCPDDSKEAMTEVEWAAQYIRTDGYQDGAKFPKVVVIKNAKELTDYYNTNKEVFDLERKDKVYSDSTIGFLDACDKYDEAYFEDQMLIMVLLEEGSGSVRHNVDNVKTGSDGKLYVAIRTIEPEVGTCDMAEWHILIELEKNVDVESESDVIVNLDGVNPKTQSAVVRETGSFSNITLTIPHDWDYEIERGNNSNEYCISFWPADQTEGKIKMWYYTAFGVCGTGLEEEEITVGEYRARKGTYDNKKVWDFIIFADMPGFYVAMNEGADKWWSGYGDEAMQILSTVKIAEGILTEQQAIDLAKKDVTVEYDQTTARFDTENGLWTVRFSKKNTAGGDQVFTVTHEGKIIDVEYGE